MDAMLAIAEQEGIIVETYPLHSPLQGIYICQSDKPPIIGLSSHIATNPERRCIMAEELGHHFTSVGICVPYKEFHHYCVRTPINKIEYKAMKWAAYHLIPENDLLDVIGSESFSGIR